MDIKGETRTLFLVHKQADLDAVGSSYFLQQRYGGDIGSPNSADGGAKKLIDHLDIDLKSSPDISKYEQIVVVDTPSPAQLEPIKIDGSSENTVIIDHHQSDQWSEDIVFEDRTSCAEVVFELVQPETLTREEGTALISGILADTSSLKRGDHHTFRNLSEILERSRVSLQSVKDILYDDYSYSEKIARIKGAKRLSHREVNGMIIASTNIGAFESSVAGSLLGLGADVGLTGSNRKERFLLSARARESIVEEGLNIGDILFQITEDFNDIEGGGHAGAGVLSGVGDLERFKNICVDRIVEYIREEEIKRPLD